MVLRNWALAGALIAAACPAAADTLVIGQVAELSGQGPVAEQMAGAKLWLDSVNDSHGPHSFVLKQYDDQRDAKLTLALTHKLVDEDNAIALFGYRSTPSLMACTPKACADIIRSVRERKNPMLFGVLSNTATDEFVKSVAPVGTNVIISQVMPYPWNTAQPLVREFNRLNALHHDSVPLSYSSLEGFAAARLLTEAVKTAGPKPTRAGLIEALRRMKNVDLGGIRYSSGEKHYFTEVTTVRSDGKIVH